MVLSVSPALRWMLVAGLKKAKNLAGQESSEPIQIPCILCSITLIRLLDLGRTFRCLSCIIDDARVRELARTIQKVSLLVLDACSVYAA